MRRWPISRSSRAGRSGPSPSRLGCLTSESVVRIMRHEKAALLLDLARRLAASAEGLTLDEMAQASGVGRRTAERMRDAIWDLFPQMEELPDGAAKRFRI